MGGLSGRSPSRRKRRILLVVDDESVYVAATKRVVTVLGYDPSEIVGLRIADLAAPELQHQTPQEWSRFLAAGRQDGQYRLRARDGRAGLASIPGARHHPVPGFHVSRMWPDDAPSDGRAAGQ